MLSTVDVPSSGDCKLTEKPTANEPSKRAAEQEATNNKQKTNPKYNSPSRRT
jgi:hypothetical protein